jgi:hypothetical protein
MMRGNRHWAGACGGLKGTFVGLIRAFESTSGPERRANPPAAYTAAYTIVAAATEVRPAAVARSALRITATSMPSCSSAPAVGGR